MDRKTLKVWLPWQLHAEFDKWCVRAGSSMQYAVRAAVEKLVGYKSPPEEPVPSFAAVTRAPVVPVAKPAYVAPAPRQQTPEEIEAEQQHKAQVAARYNPGAEYQKWRRKGNTPEKARSHVAGVCANLGIMWEGPAPEEESRVAEMITKHSTANTEEENGGE